MEGETLECGRIERASSRLAWKKLRAVLRAVDWSAATSIRWGVRLPERSFAL